MVSAITEVPLSEGGAEKELFLDVDAAIDDVSSKAGLCLKVKLSDKSMVAVLLGAAFLIFLMLLTVLWMLTVLLVV
ncbi:hypothetical protein D0894_18860 [Pseudomonas monteilii]|uniref:Uncharacterized protein n=1 Tax=Pseudomonas monteilii TaxID=76759 RepID=A0A399M258_9PSED|nr:hypothetical protein D0894_18860 [Pseudomonas monteilii]